MGVQTGGFIFHLYVSASYQIRLYTAIYLIVT